MNIQIDTPVNQSSSVDIQTLYHRISSSALNIARLILHFLEMTVAMMFGMPLLFALRSLIPASSSFAAAFKSGTVLSELAMAVFMTVPMVAWMIVRGHGRRHSLEMGLGMFAPVAAIVVLRLLGADAYMPWLRYFSHPAMFLGMLAAMLYRRDHFTGKAGHRPHTAHHVTK